VTEAATSLDAFDTDILSKFEQIDHCGWTILSNRKKNAANSSLRIMCTDELGSGERRRARHDAS